jgi:UDP-N-acetylmuramoylalanine--D-glutamate ligase
MSELDAVLASPRRALLVGLGITNRAVAGALVRRGNHPVGVDDHPDDSLREAANCLGIELATASELPALLAEADVVLPTPGLAETHPIFAAAHSAGIPIVSEFDLAAVWDSRPVLAITGTNGKTTSVELAVAALRAAGRVAASAGNTDVPLVTAIDDPQVEVFVVEASSFRLSHACRFRPQVGTWLNFAPDHLDVHRDLATYEAAKAQVFNLLAEDGVAVANANDPIVMSHVPRDRRATTFGTDGDWRVEGTQLVGPDGVFGTTQQLWRSLPHDIEDTLAVAASVQAFGVDPAYVVEAAEQFTPLAHRVSPVGCLDGQWYYDDSKATTPHATLSALRGFDRVVLIAGGRNKGIDLSTLAGASDRTVAVVAIGESADDIEKVFAGHCPVARASDMDEAVQAARRYSAGAVPVLLSPACASFDWYRNYGERGDDFARAVRAAGGER